MSAIKDGRYPIEINGKTYYLLFSLNALDEIQDKFGGYDKLDKVFDESDPNMIKNLKWLLALLINEGMEEGETELSEKQVGKMIHIGNMQVIERAIFASFTMGVAGDKSKGEQEENSETEIEEGNTAAVQEK